MEFSFVKLISSSDTSTKRDAAIWKICPPAKITSPEVIVAEYDGQKEREDFYNHLSNYTNDRYHRVTVGKKKKENAQFSGSVAVKRAIFELSSISKKLKRVRNKNSVIL